MLSLSTDLSQERLCMAVQDEPHGLAHLVADLALLAVCRTLSMVRSKALPAGISLRATAAGARGDGVGDFHPLQQGRPALFHGIV